MHIQKKGSAYKVYVSVGYDGKKHKFRTSTFRPPKGLTPTQLRRAVLEFAEAFERKVIKARCAHDRLIEFLKRAKANATYFNQLGFEDIDLNFSFFDIIRQTRNDSGHPTGNTITLEQFKMLLSNYQHFLPKTIAAIKTIQSQVI